MAKSTLNSVGVKLNHFAHPRKAQIMETILTNDNNIHVSLIYKKLKLEQSVVSSLISQMRKDGILKGKRDGRKIVYSVDKKRVEVLTNGLLTLLGTN